ncbi:MAG: PmeII family type II restriction endonuclease [bacterium]|nr:PmeII family type II restriction endonuclease [bacterium]
MNEKDLEGIIKNCLANFYARRKSSLNDLDFTKVLKRKNPYMFRAKGIPNVGELVGELLNAYVSSSDESMFGDEFFEPICQAASNANIAASKGVDFIIESSDSYQAISLKSGPNAFNSDQVSKLNQRFEEVEGSLRATLRRVKKYFVPIMGCGYGVVNSEPTSARKYFKLAGQAFWTKITGDEQFYQKMLTFMDNEPDIHYLEFKELWDKKFNLFVKMFTINFCDGEGNILWEKLLQYNSGSEKISLKK